MWVRNQRNQWGMDDLQSIHIIMKNGHMTVIIYIFQTKTTVNLRMIFRKSTHDVQNVCTVYAEINITELHYHATIVLGFLGRRWRRW